MNNKTGTLKRSYKVVTELVLRRESSDGKLLYNPDETKVYIERIDKTKKLMPPEER